MDVVKYKLSNSGPGRGSALVGKSMHNQQMECLWWDVFKAVLKNFHELFSLMEDLNILDSLAENDLWCLHYAFLHHINHCLDEWSASWLRHPMWAILKDVVSPWHVFTLKVLLQFLQRNLYKIYSTPWKVVTPIWPPRLTFGFTF